MRFILLLMDWIFKFIYLKYLFKIRNCYEDWWGDDDDDDDNCGQKDDDDRDYKRSDDDDERNLI